jgi:long-chain acyl-CoA synthetase
VSASDEVPFARFAREAPQIPAIVDSSGRSCARGELYATMNQISRGLRAANVDAGDVVAIVAPNCIEFLAVYMACTQIGAYVVPINWHLAKAEIEYILLSSEAKAIFAHERVGRLVRGVLSTGRFELRARVSLGNIEGFTPLEHFVASQSVAAIEKPTQGRVLVYTSATTGRPKAIVLPLTDAASCLASTIRFNIASGLEPEREVHLCASMLYHTGPLDFAAVALHMGHLVVLVEKWEPVQLLELIQSHRVTTALMVPTMFVRLLKLPLETRQACDTSSLKYVLHTAAPCPVDTKRQMLQWWGPVIFDGYGASEGVGTVATAKDWLERPGTVGRPVPGTKLRILDDSGDELPVGEVGTIYLTRYQGDRFEYKDDPEKTRAAYRGEFFTVGDIGYLDADGYLFICDRKIDMIISGGMNIYSAEIEQVLVQHRDVVDCAVFGVPDAIMGEVVHAAIQLAPGVAESPAVTLDIMAHLRGQLAAGKLPRRYEFVRTLPRDPNGKLFKRLLRQRHWQTEVPV